MQDKARERASQLKQGHTARLGNAFDGEESGEGSPSVALHRNHRRGHGRSQSVEIPTRRSDNPLLTVFGARLASTVLFGCEGRAGVLPTRWQKTPTV